MIKDVESRKGRFIEQRNATIGGVERRKMFRRRPSQFNKRVR